VCGDGEPQFFIFLLPFFKAVKNKKCGGSWNGGFFSRLERRHATKRTTEERPLYCLLFVCRLFLFKPKIIVLDDVFR
jgi:hypothetical protein